jgi:hypothetical protein
MVDLERMLDLATPWCLRVAATLRIPEHIAAGHAGIAGIAAAAGCDADALHPAPSRPAATSSSAARARRHRHGQDPRAGTRHDGQILEPPAPDGPTRTLATIADSEGNPSAWSATRHRPRPACAMP